MTRPGLLLSVLVTCWTLLVPTFPTFSLPNQMLRMVPAKADYIEEKVNYKTRGTKSVTRTMSVYCYGDIADPQGRPVPGIRIEAAKQTLSVTRPATAPASILLNYAVSYVSPEQAKRNFAGEVASSRLEDLVARGKAAWARVLGRLAVEGGSEAQKRSFYTALYRTHERMVDINEGGRYYSGYDAWVLAQLAKELGKQEDYERFSRVAENYRILWHPEKRLFMPKDDQGEWIMIDPKLDGGPGYRDYHRPAERQDVRDHRQGREPAAQVHPQGLSQRQGARCALHHTPRRGVGRHAGTRPGRPAEPRVGQQGDGPALSCTVRHLLLALLMATLAGPALAAGPWKLIDGLGSGGFSQPSKITAGPGDPAGQGT